MKVRAKKVPKWESEMGSLVSSGDGEHCPLYGVDTVGHCTKCCLKETKEMVSALDDTRVVGSSKDGNKVDAFRNLFEQKVSRNWVSGRILQFIKITANKKKKQTKY